MNHKPLLLTATFLSGCLLNGCLSTETAEAPPAVETASPTTSPLSETSQATAPETQAPAPQTIPPTTPPTEAPTEPFSIEGGGTAEVFSRITVGEFVRCTGGELLEPERLLDTDALGEHTLEIACLRGGETLTWPLTYTVQDTTPPVVLSAGENAGVLLGQRFDLGELVGFGDNYDPRPVLTCSGNVDTSTAGCYPVTATVTDSSGNAVSWEVQVTVAAQLPKPESRPAESFADFAAMYGDIGDCGIDVSKWQGDVDWTAVHEAGVRFVLIRCGYGDSGIQADERYLQNIRQAAAAGLEVGGYFYSTATDAETARRQAAWFAEQLRAAEVEITLPAAFDWESFGRFQRFGMSLHELNGIYDAFSQEMAAQGFETMLYAERPVLGTAWETAGRTVWLAQYTDTPELQGASFWQHANTGRVPGISGDVDLDVRVWG